jgi:hypothetical protein
VNETATTAQASHHLTQSSLTAQIPKLQFIMQATQVADYTGLQNVNVFLSHKKNKVILIVFCKLNSNITLVSFYHARFSSDAHFKFEENVCFEQFTTI